MFPYWILFSACAIGALNPRGYDRPAGANPILVAIGFFIALFIGLRFEVGADWFNYLQIFNFAAYAELGDALRLSDPGYHFLNWIAHQVGVGVWFVNIVCAFIFVWGLIKFASVQPNPWLCLLVAVPYLTIVVAMGFTRQGVALGILLAGLATIEQKSIFRFGIYVVVAAAFHKTAIAVLPLIAVAAMRQRPSTLIPMLLLGAGVGYFFVRRALVTLSASYIEQDYDASGALIRLFMNVVPALIFLLFQKRFVATPFELRLWRNFALAALATLVLFYVLPSSVIVDRLAIYLIPVQLFVFSRMPAAFLDRGKANLQVTIAIIVYSAVVQGTWLYFAGHAEYWLPYKVYPFGTAISSTE